jgi:hypothetical protein
MDLFQLATLFLFHILYYTLFRSILILLIFICNTNSVIHGLLEFTYPVASNPCVQGNLILLKFTVDAQLKFKFLQVF